MKLRITSEQVEEGTRYVFYATCPHMASPAPQHGLGIQVFIYKVVMTPDAVRVVTKQAIAALNKALTCGCRVDEEEEST